MTKQIAVAVVEHESCFLIGQRPQGVPLAGLWEFPGGKMEPQETAKVAAVRECREETELAVEAEGTWLVQEEEYPHGRVRLHFIACRLAAQATSEPKPPFRWVPRHELASYEFPSGNRELLNLLANR
ncbi:MAG: (deoxy)nucleoside triphosphate pyrophosphohydrolase [Planctomycetales bacterium]|nr:(deoxy)nucleoside triphosphate pyrophosphohydrolase [Planctomycetales bacterium]